MGLINDTLIAEVINFLILLYAMKKWVYPPLRKILADRRARIEGAIQQADADRETANRLRLQYEQQLQKARQEAQTIRDQAEKLAADKSAAILQEAKLEADRLFKEAKADIEAERRVAMQELQTHVTDLSIKIAEKLLREHMDDATNRRLVSVYLDEQGLAQ